MAFTPFTKDDLPTMAAFNEKLQQVIDEALFRGLKMETGSYVGTGTFGKDNQNSLTFGFVPKFVLISIAGAGINSNHFKPYSWYSVIQTGYMYNDLNALSSSTTVSMYSKLTVSGNTISWYNEASAEHQGNYIGIIHHYIAIG